MNGAFVPFKPEPVHHSQPSPEDAAKLAALRAEFLARALEQQRRYPQVFKPLAR